jgi:murein DD-endopeptidase MepM/ murein hydrolase activator NlpD
MGSASGAQEPSTDNDPGETDTRARGALFAVRLSRQETVLQKPTGGARRHADDECTDRAQRPATSRLNRLTRRASRALQARLDARATATGAALARTLRPFTHPERALPIAVASIVAVAALLAFLPSTPQGAVGGVQGRGTDVRLAVNGGIDRPAPVEPVEVVEPVDSSSSGRTIADPEAAAFAAPEAAAFAAPGPAALADPEVADEPSFQAVTLPSFIPTQPVSEEETLEAPVTDDGTILTGYAPMTTVEDGSDLIRSYKVKKGDTLASVAKKYDVSKMTLWWANKLKANAELKAGTTLRIPPVSGLVYTVKATDTLESLAAKHKIKPDKIVELNGLEDPTLVVDQVLVLPGAKGAPMPTPKPKPARDSRIASSGGTAAGLGGKYTGGTFRWPVVGGGNYVSQYFHYGHYGLDVAADYGSKVVAAAGGKVIFAGWKSNGGGYQVWISHGGGLYTTYSHMSGVSVGRGQGVDRGQQVGRIGQSGYATGPHLHFETWKGPVWNGGSRLNPLRYF